MATIRRRFVEGEWPQGKDELFSYFFSTLRWGGCTAPTSVTVALYDITDGGYVDMSGSLLTGSVSVVADVITTPIVTSLVPDHVYQLEVKWNWDNNTWEVKGTIKAEL